MDLTQRVSSQTQLPGFGSAACVTISWRSGFQNADHNSKLHAIYILFSLPKQSPCTSAWESWSEHPSSPASCPVFLPLTSLFWGCGANEHALHCESSSSAILPSGSEHGSPLLQSDVLFAVVLLVWHSLRMPFSEARLRVDKPDSPGL